MTNQQTNTIQTKLRTATATLAEMAVRHTTFEAYLDECIKLLLGQFPELSPPVHLNGVIVKHPTLDLIPLDKTISPELGPFGQLPMSASRSGLTLEFRLPPKNNEPIWNTLQFWSHMLSQVWEASPNYDVKERLHLYRNLSLVAQRVNRELATEHVLIEACQSIVETMSDVDHVGLVINDNAPISATVFAEYPDVGNTGARLNLVGYRVFEVMQDTLQPVVINRLEDHKELLGDNYEILKAVGIKSNLIFPLVIQNSMIGSIGIDTLNQYHTFTQAEIEILGLIADQIAISIHNAELFDDVSSRIVSEALTSRVTEKLPLRADLNTLMQTAARELGVVLGARSARVYLNEDYLNPSTSQRKPETKKG